MTESDRKRRESERERERKGKRTMEEEIKLDIEMRRLTLPSILKKCSAMEIGSDRD